MGIPSYFSFIVKNHPNIVKQYIKKNFPIDNLFLDSNSIIYDIYNTTYKNMPFDKNMQTNLIYSVLSKIDNYIELFSPQKSVYIAFDGVAPVAKLEQQRSRRYKTWYQNEVTRSIMEQNVTDAWNTTAITPGTIFMKTLNEMLYKHFNGYKNISAIVSGSDMVGEGEHKIFEYIRNNKLIKNEVNVIYGLDADLIMLCINHLQHSNKLYLIRESPHFIQSLNKNMDPNENYILDISELSKEVLNMMSNIEINAPSRVNDYIFICFLLGNDFMPHFPSVNIRRNGVFKVIDAYKETIGVSSTEFLTDGNVIYWSNVKKMFEHLAAMEHAHLIDEYKYRSKYNIKKMNVKTNEDKLNMFNSLPIYERDDEKYIDPSKPGWEDRYYINLFKIKDVNKKDKEKICVNYLEGLEWVMKYYTTGCVDWRWKYHYNYPPLFSDLIKYIPDNNVSYFKEIKNNPVNALTLLCYVLPRPSLNLIPGEIFHRLITEHEDWYSDKWEIKWAFCRYFWESHVIMKDIDINELEEFLAEHIKN